MFESYSFVMRMLRAPARPLAEAVPALFEHLLAIFAPRRLVFTVDAGELSYLTRGELGHWNGEERTGDALTRCEPGDAAALVDELRRALATARPERIWIGAEGALLHRAPHTEHATWYGRWRMHRTLYALIEPSFAWTAEQRELELRFPLAGYPLTATELSAEPDGECWIVGGDPAAAAANRARVFDVLAAIPGVLGLAGADVAWALHGDAEALHARYPDDARALADHVTRLHA